MQFIDWTGERSTADQRCVYVSATVEQKWEQCWASVRAELTDCVKLDHSSGGGFC